MLPTWIIICRNMKLDSYGILKNGFNKIHLIKWIKFIKHKTWNFKPLKRKHKEETSFNLVLAMCFCIWHQRRKQRKWTLSKWGCAVLCLVSQLGPTLCNPMNFSPLGTSVRGESPGENIREGCHGLLHVIFPTQGLNPGPPYCRWILYQLSQQGSPRILEWVAYPFSYPFSMWPSTWPRIEPGSPALQADSLPAELPGNPSGTTSN